MKRVYTLVCFVLIILLLGCGKSDFYGEYSYDGEPRYDVKIMNNDTVTINIDNMFTMDYKKNGDRLEVVQDDVYYYYTEGVTEVYFEKKDKDTLAYKVLVNDEEEELGEFQYIEGTDGDSGEPNMFWMTVKNIFYGLIIFFFIFSIMLFIMWKVKKSG